MKQEALSHFSDIHLTIIGFFIFLITFVAIMIWTFRKSAQGHYQKMAEIPLAEAINGKQK